MNLSEKIISQVKALPESKQAEVLDFVEFISSRSARQDEEEWSEFSLSSAMRAMEKEPSPYGLSDLEESFT